MRCLTILLLLSLRLAAADLSVVRLNSFEIFTTASGAEAKEAANFADQLRYTLGWQLGNTDLQPVWPVRVLLVKKGQPTSPDCRLAREAFVCSIASPGPEFALSLTKILLDSWVGHLPPPLERGLLQLFTTIDIQGTRITLGAKPAQTDRDWSRAHMLAVDPMYSGKLRVMLGNLSKGVEPEVAYRNAFGQGPEAIEQSLDHYLEAGNFGTFNAPSRAFNAQKQLIAKEAIPEDLRLLEADILLARGNSAEAKARYGALLKANEQLAGAHEGLGFAALQTGDKATAEKELALGTSARGMAEYSRLLSDREQQRAALVKAAAANPRWAEPWLMLATVESHPAQKLAALKKAVQLQPGRAQLWTELARLQESTKQFADAAKSWAAAERATGDPSSREEVRQLRLAGERLRLEADIAAKEEARRRTQAELDDLRNRSLMDIRAAEARANAGRPQLDPQKLDPYRENAETKKITGSLARVECAGSQAKLFVTRGKQTTVLLVPDSKTVAVTGGQVSLACGMQRPAKRVNVEYTPRDVGGGLVGDVVSVEFTAGASANQ